MFGGVNARGGPRGSEGRDYFYSPVTALEPLWNKGNTGVPSGAGGVRVRGGTGGGDTMSPTARAQGPSPEDQGGPNGRQAQGAGGLAAHRQGDGEGRGPYQGVARSGRARPQGRT